MNYTILKKCVDQIMDQYEDQPRIKSYVLKVHIGSDQTSTTYMIGKGKGLGKFGIDRVDQTNDQEMIKQINHIIEYVKQIHPKKKVLYLRYNTDRPNILDILNSYPSKSKFIIDFEKRSIYKL
jgi:hypothetical protein